MDSLLNRLILECLKFPETEFFDRLLLKINDHYEAPAHGITEIKNKNKEKGNLFEYLCLRLICVNAFRAIKPQAAWLFKDIPTDIREYLGLTNKDMGIDIVVQTINNEFLAVQCKYKKKSRYARAPNGAYIKHQIGWKNLATFYSLCDRTGPSAVDSTINNRHLPRSVANDQRPSYSVGWTKHIVMTTAASVNRQGRNNPKDLNICLGTFRGLDKEVWFKLVGDSGHKLTDEIITDRMKESRNKFLDKLIHH